MIPATLVHNAYDFSVLFAVPTAFAEARDVVGGDQWHMARGQRATLPVRACRLDEFSDYGFLTGHSDVVSKTGPSLDPTYGLLLSDARADIDAFAEAIGELPPDWNFGGVIAIDLQSGVGFNTNCDIAETSEWRRVLARLRGRNNVEVTFRLSDVGLSMERRESDLIVQQTAWEVPDGWGPQGRDHYPRHRFVRGQSAIDRLSAVLNGFEMLCEECYESGYSWLSRRLGMDA